MMEINDSDGMTGFVREQRLRELGAEVGIRFKFVN